MNKACLTSVWVTLLIALGGCPAHSDPPARGEDRAEAPGPPRDAHDAQPSRADSKGNTSKKLGKSLVYEGRRQLMGTDFKVSVAGVSEAKARSAIEAALDRVAEVERALSPYRDESDVSRINAGAGGAPVKISEETLALLERAREVSERSGGAFDVTYAALSPIWRSLRERPPRLPADGDVEAARALVGFKRLILDRATMTASLRARGMRINLGGIGKGHGVDEAGEVLEAQGITNFIVGGGGDLLVRGNKLGGPWRLGVQHPRERGFWGYLALEGPLAVVTSGDYERFVELEGTRYHHIIDPRTGRPVRDSVAVTLIAPDATLADAMATAVFVLGPEAGMRLVESTDGVDALIIDEHLKMTISPGLEKIFSRDPPGR